MAAILSGCGFVPKALFPRKFMHDYCAAGYYLLNELEIIVQLDIIYERFSYC